MPVQPYLDVGLLLLVVCAAVNDLAARRIPNRLLLAGLVAALALHALGPDPGAALAASLLGAATGLLVFLPLYALGGTAAGDVKLMAAVGAFVGAAEAFEIAMLAWCAGGLMALAIVLARGRLRRALANVGTLLRPLWRRAAGIPAVTEPLAAPSVGTMPYGLAIAAATLLALARHG